MRLPEIFKFIPKKAMKSPILTIATSNGISILK